NTKEKKLLKEHAEQCKIHAARAAAREGKTTPTPGPWNRSLSDCRVILGPSCSYKNGRIADVGSGVPWSDEVDANASLIAAAPDLLAASRAMLEAIDDFLHVDENGDNSGDLNSVSNQLPNLRAAIAKAEGL